MGEGGGKTGRKGLRVVDGFDGNIVTCTHVMKCLCWPMVWISFTRKVWSLTSPGRRHSSSYRPDKRIQNDWDKFRFVLQDKLHTKALCHIGQDTDLQYGIMCVLTRTEMIPLCFSSTRSQMTLLSKYSTGSHCKERNSCKSNSCSPDLCSRIWREHSKYNLLIGGVIM